MTTIQPEKEKLSVQVSTPSVCFVCTGNTCRSPMAEVVYNTLAQGQSFAVSRGIAPHVGDPISPNAIKALSDAGYPVGTVSDHIALPLDDRLVSCVGKIVCMTSPHAVALLSLFPAQAGKISVFPFEISDPYGGTPERYAECLKEIEKAIETMFGLKK